MQERLGVMGKKKMLHIMYLTTLRVGVCQRAMSLPYTHRKMIQPFSGCNSFSFCFVLSFYLKINFGRLRGAWCGLSRSNQLYTTSTRWSRFGWLSFRVGGIQDKPTNVTESLGNIWNFFWERWDTSSTIFHIIFQTFSP